MSPTPLVSDSSCSNSVLATDTATDPPSSTVIPPTQKLSDIPSITDWIDERCIEPDTQMASSQQDLSSPPRSQEHDDDESSQHDHSHSDQLSELDDRAKMPPPAMPKNQKGANGYHEQDKQETNGDDTLDMDAEASQVFNGQVEHADSTTSTDPAAKIPDFDWDDLKAQQVQKMTELNQHEAEIMAEFDQVTQLFAAWSSVASQHEAQRAEKRLLTRIAHVQNSEDELEGKRRKYEDVMKAFQRALKLLEGST